MMFRNHVLRPGPALSRVACQPSHIRTKSYTTQHRVNPSVTVYMGREEKRLHNLLAPSKDFPFNGNVSASDVYLGKITTPVPEPETIKVTTTEQHRKMRPMTVSQLLDLVSKRIERSKSYRPEKNVLDFRFCFDDEVLTIDTVQCPRLLRKELLKVFKSANKNFVSDTNVSVINILQKEVRPVFGDEITAEERLDAKMLYFIETADIICDSLSRSGYWADYIDPHSGRARRSPTDATDRLLNPDSERKAIGFRMENLKECVRISQLSFTNHTYVGSIFTNAPVEEANMSGFLDAMRDPADDFRQED